MPSYAVTVIANCDADIFEVTRLAADMGKLAALDGATIEGIQIHTWDDHDHDHVDVPVDALTATDPGDHDV